MPATKSVTRLFLSPAPHGRRGRDLFHAKSTRLRDAVKDAAGGARLAYVASELPGRETWKQTPEGYRIYLNVPIARTGSQEYIGRELKRNRGYNPEWNLGDDERVTVLRPLNEVTAPIAVASGEGKSVLDLHPAGDKVLIDALDEFDDYTKGHATNLRVGDALPDGETPVLADLWVKHPELNMKVESGEAREVSCGYTFVLDRDEAGQYIQRKICINHIAIVPKGRAGQYVGIQDAAPTSQNTRSSKMSKPNVSFRSMLQALGLAAWIKDKDTDAVADAMAELEGDEGMADKGAKDKKGAKDDADESDKKDKKDKDEDGSKDDDGDHPKGCRCEAKDCMAAMKDAKDKKGAKDGDGDEEDLEEVEKESAKDKKGAKDDAEIMAPADRTETLFSTGDAAAFLADIRPTIAKSKNVKERKAFNALARVVRSAQDGIKDGKPDPFLDLVSPSANGVNDAEPEIPMFQFFNGVEHSAGLKAWNEYQADRAAARRPNR